MKAHEISTQDLCNQIPNRFQMIIAASLRAKEIARGSQPKTNIKSNKPTTTALIEILEGKTGVEILDKLAKKK